MASLETIGPLMTGMKSRPDMSGLACEALNRMFQREQTELVAQVQQWPLTSPQVTGEVLNSLNHRLLLCKTGSESGPGSILAEASGRGGPGDTRKPFSYQSPDSESSQVHDSQFTVWRAGLCGVKTWPAQRWEHWWDRSASFIHRWMRF